MDADERRFAELLREARCVLVFTGAGISTGSGIPDFRGPAGIWKRRQPVYIQEFMTSESKRREYWNYKLEGREAFLAARPNAAHLALRDLEQLGRLDTLVTQNIDGLHHLSGVSEERVVELHGTNRLVACLACGERTDPTSAFEEFERTGVPPVCSCGGFLKPATISFGQSLPPDALEKAWEAAERADLAVALGSTLAVEPAASIPLAAARRGAGYVVVNRGPTAHDELATLGLEGDLVELMPRVVAKLRGMLSSS